MEDLKLRKALLVNKTKQHKKLFALSNSIFIPVFLAVDFLIRTTNNSRYSPIANLSVAIVKYTKIENSYVNAGPKLFATRVGLIFSSLIFIASLLNANLLTLSLTSILVFFSFLEAVFGFCVACKLYPFIYKILYRQKFGGLKMAKVNLSR